ncbi:MAG: transcriptional regulator, IclR family [Firmicutes bacterium]|nr:transcriptional regulator, IclR family [Bacillota bacterium]
MSNEAQKDGLNNSIAKAVTILNCFTYEKYSLRLKEISMLTGINQATAYRMLSTLKEFNLIEQHNGEYSLGRGFLKYQGIVLNSIEIRRVVLPYLEELSNNLKITANLAILDDYEVVFVARAETPYSAYGYFHIGMRRPIYCTAVGKVLTCKTPEIAQEAFKRGAKRYTLNTITDEGRFLEELETVRLQGYAMDLEEWTNGVNCLAVPLHNMSGDIVAGISISGPITTYPTEKMKEFVPLMLEYAHRISSRMGAFGGF